MAEYEITHTTVYSYSENVSHCQNIAYLLPQSDARQTCEKTEITLSPQPAISADHTDYYGNRFLYFAVEQPHRQLSVTAKTHIRTYTAGAVNEENSLPGDILAQNLRNPTDACDIAAVEYLLPSPFVTLSKAFAEYAAASFSPNRPVLAAAPRCLSGFCPPRDCCVAFDGNSRALRERLHRNLSPTGQT
jgi:transglutaminase-like putative cysteine protease